MKFVSPSLPFLVMLASFSGSASAQVTAPGLRRRLDSNSSAVAKDGNAPVVPATADNTTSPFKVPTKAPPKSSTLHSEAERTHRVWVQYKTDVTRSVCLESLQSKIMASTGAPAAEAKALLQAQGETVTTKSSSSSSANGQSRFRMHYDFFDTKLGSMVMTVDDAMLRSLQDDPTVKRIGKDVKRFPMVLKEDAGELANKDKHGSRNLQDELLPYGVSMVQADQVWNQGFKGQGVTVCVIDSGLDVFHPEFRTDWVGFSTEAGDWFSDKSSHGTHTSGTIAARWNGQGVVGVAPEATVLTFKVFNALGEFAYASGVANAALSCQSAGANVVSMSLGGPEFSQEESDTFKLLFEQGVVSVAAAGNDGSTDYSFPGSYLEVVSVGAVDSAKSKASFSQTNDRVDLVAPGVDVLSTVPQNMGSYGRKSGTSMATPHVAGVAALLLSKSPTASAADIVSAMTSTAEDLGRGGYDTWYGNGLVNALAALASV